VGSPTDQRSALVELRGISKSFGGVHALRDVGFRLDAGQIHALAGENGAGKSTFVKIIAGAYTPDSGEIVVAGASYAALSAQSARALGIAVVYQEFNLLPELSVAENIFLGDLPTGSWRTVSRRNTARRAGEILRRLGSGIDVNALVATLSVADQQFVEIAKALAVDAKVIIMDEPSTVLAPEELQSLYRVLRMLREEGRGIIYISHRLSEVFELADRVTVFKDGAFVSSDATTELDEQELIRRMVGRPVSEIFPRRPEDAGPAGPVVVSVDDLDIPGKLSKVSVEVRAGEIVGLAGLGGSGRTTLCRALVGLERIAGGRIRLHDRPAPGSPGRSARAGLVMVPEDRKAHGIVAGQSIAANLVLPSLHRLRRLGALMPGRQRTLVKSLVSRFDVRPPLPSLAIENLSGGNQQKVVLARWLACEPTAVLLDEPTRGVDVGAKAEIYAMVEQLRASGVAVLFASSDLIELLGMCDRIVVMREGTVAAQLDRAEATEESILTAAVASAPLETRQEVA